MLNPKKRALTLAEKTPRRKSLEEYTWGKSYRYILVVALLPRCSCYCQGQEHKDRTCRSTLRVLLRSQGLWPRDRDRLHSKLALLIFLNKIKVNAKLCALAVWLCNYSASPAWTGSPKHRGNAQRGSLPGKGRIITNSAFAHHLLKLSGQGPSCWHRHIWHLTCIGWTSGYSICVLLLL